METRQSLQVRIAKKAVESYVMSSVHLDPSEVPNLPEGQNYGAGTFVSIKKDGKLRGCMGTISPTKSSLSEEIINNAVSSAARDPRFPPVIVDELDSIEITVDVLTPLEPVSSKKELDPLKYGLVVSSAGRKGLLLPDLDGVDTVERQISICRSKGGIAPDEDITLHRFEVRRYR